MKPFRGRFERILQNFQTIFTELLKVMIAIFKEETKTSSERGCCGVSGGGSKGKEKGSILMLMKQS